MSWVNALVYAVSISMSASLEFEEGVVSLLIRGARPIQRRAEKRRVVSETAWGTMDGLACLCHCMSFVFVSGNPSTDRCKLCSFGVCLSGPILEACEGDTLTSLTASFFLSFLLQLTCVNVTSCGGAS